MSKFVSFIVGGLEIGAGLFLEFVTLGASTPLTVALIVAGAGTVLAGIGTLLSQSAIKGFVNTIRNPTAPWEYIYGRCETGGGVGVFSPWPKPGNGAGGNDQIIDLIIVVATHSCESIDALLFDQQRIQIDTNARPSGAPASAGTSFNPVDQNIGPGTGGIPNITRLNGVVTVTLNQNIPYLIPGDNLQIAGIGSGFDTSLNGTFQVQQILVQTPTSLVFTYLCGGANVTVTGQGQVNTLWAKY